jgi:hypothetical protein
VQAPSQVTSGRSHFSTAAPRLLAIAAWLGVLLQLWLSIRLALANGRPVVGGLINYFGYFTILTNIFVALVCTAGSLSRRAADRSLLYTLPAVGCATAAILVVGIGYHALLREIWAPQGAEWVANLLLHYIVPVVALLHWFGYSYADPPKWWAPLSWCWYPLAYFAYVMTRGEILFSYPYPFIDVLALGYTQTIVNAIGFLIGFIVLGYVLLGLKRLATMVKKRAGEGVR